MDGTRLVTYRTGDGEARAGLVVAGRVHDIAAATGVAADATMLGLLEDWQVARPRIAAARREAECAVGGGHALEGVTLLAPLPRPGTVFCAGANYADHVAEMARLRGRAPDPSPKALGLSSWHFIKSSRSIVGPDAAVALPRSSRNVDWEAELALVIGRKAKDVTEAEALSHVAGYTIANDLSARDLGPREGVPDSSPFKYDWLAHKSFDGSCPLGPWIVPADEVADPMGLPISLSVNGATKQDSNTREMIFGIAEQIAHLSQRLTLWPGDVILTGTPAGVGSARGAFLQPGDTVVVRIGGLGELATRIVA
jgi:2-keto-4-pentenoate hydratase/2-oxohepta-3-ene-1,7-dioic acid hydratase in catechol pathway